MVFTFTWALHNFRVCILSVRLGCCIQSSIIYPGRIMVERPTSKHLGLEAAISRAADSLSYILKSEQEQCL